MNVHIYTSYVEQVYKVACLSLGDPLVTDPGQLVLINALMLECAAGFSVVCVCLTERTSFKLISFSSKQYTHGV